MFFLINKPLWYTSFDVIRKLRKILNTKKLWHTGTLDPLATWVLLIATDGSTKLIPQLEKLEKTYICTIRIDGMSPSLDLGTPVTPHSISEIQDHSPQELHDFLLSQTEQIPPQYSALHIDGVRAYEKARNGEDFEMKKRSISVPYVEILGLHPPEIRIRIRISSGWYIRSFAPLIGQYFWLLWGYVSELHRECIHLPWGWSLDDSSAHLLETLWKHNCIPYGQLFPHFYEEVVDALITQKLHEGRLLDIADIPWIYNVWDTLLLSCSDGFHSLVTRQEDGFHIIKNKI